MAIEYISTHAISAGKPPPPTNKTKPHDRLDWMWLQEHVHRKDWHTSLITFTVWLIRHALNYDFTAREATEWPMASYMESLGWSKEEPS
jgi:hypothetical protein